MTAVVDVAASLSMLGVEYAGNVGRTCVVVLISFGGSLGAAVLTGGSIRVGTCRSLSTM